MRSSTSSERAALSSSETQSRPSSSCPSWYDEPASVIAEELDLDVAGVGDVPLHKDAAGRARGGRLALACAKGRGQVRLAEDGTHAAPAATANGLEHDGELEV